MIISAHTLVKNEEKFIWYTIMSAIKHLDEILIWDTGSTDSTIEIIEEIRKDTSIKDKIHLRKFKPGFFKEEEFRQKMLTETKGNWIFVLDGDEIWWEDSIRRVTRVIRGSGDKIESIVVPTYNPVGDLFHYQEERAGRYRLAGKVGHLNLRAFSRSIPGLAWSGEYGVGERRHLQEASNARSRRVAESGCRAAGGSG